MIAHLSEECCVKYGRVKFLHYVYTYMRIEEGDDHSGQHKVYNVPTVTLILVTFKKF